MKSPLDDPENAAFAWARFRRIMRGMGVLTAMLVILALATLYATNERASVHFYIAVALGVAGAMLLTSALMGLVFLSNRTGHDDAIHDPLEDESEY